MHEVIREGAVDAPVRILLAHGAGAGMEHAFLAELSRLLAGPDIEVVRFNFPYMSKRALDGKRRPPDRQPVLLDHWREMVREFAHPRLFLAGKSMGGRMAAEISDEIYCEMNAAGLLILGYPFHPRLGPTVGGARFSSRSRRRPCCCKGSATLSVLASNWPIFLSHPPYRSTG